MKNRFLSLLVTMLISIPLSGWAATDQIYHRVIKTQTINCGYAEWAPFVVTDPNTKEVSGFMHDLWSAIGNKLGLKINWLKSAGWGEVVETVDSKKIDAWCAGAGANPHRIQSLLLSRPVFYNALYLWKRADDSRFDNDYDALNQSSVTLVGEGGDDIMASVLEQKFPNAKKANVPSSAPEEAIAQSLIAKKGDAALMDGSFAEGYIKHHPGKIKQIQGAPVSVISVVFPLSLEEYQLKNMIDTALNELINDGTVAALIKKYDTQKTFAPQPDLEIK